MTDEALENTVRADDPEAYLRRKALELHRTSIPKSRNHLGYLTEVYKDGSTVWGELSTDEPLEHRDQYLEWAVMLAEKIPLQKVLGLGYSYSVLDVLCLFHIKPRGVLGESVRVHNTLHGEWYRNVVPDPFAQTLWAVLRKEG